MVSKEEKKQIEEYVKYLTSKGYSKKQIQDFLLKKGFNRFLIRKIIYPNIKLFLASGIILVIMILVIGGFYTYAMVYDKPIIPPIKANEKIEVKGISVEDIQISGEGDSKTIKIALKNNNEEVIKEQLEIKASSGDFYLYWIEPRTIQPGEIFITDASGFMIPEPEVKIYINNQLMFTKNI